MALPTKTQISEAVETANNIKDSKLMGFHTIPGILGAESYSGGFCMVFPFEDNTGKKYAFRVWHTEIDGIKERIAKIADYLTLHPVKPYFVEFEYVTEALDVPIEDGQHQLVDALRMEWVQGKNLIEYIDSIIVDATITADAKKTKLQKLADDFLMMVKTLHQQGISHGDLQHGNIMLNDNGEIRLVDYDSVYVPTFQSDYMQITEGIDAYQHPYRHEKNVPATKEDDYFSEYIIYASLLALADSPSIWVSLSEDQENSHDEYSLLWTQSDMEDLEHSTLFNQVYAQAKVHQNTLLEALLGEIKRVRKQQNCVGLRPIETIRRFGEDYGQVPSPVSIEVGSEIEDFLNGLCASTKKATYQRPQKPVIDFDEDAARKRYSQN